MTWGGRRVCAEDMHRANALIPLVWIFANAQRPFPPKAVETLSALPCKLTARSFLPSSSRGGTTLLKSCRAHLGKLDL